MKYALLIYNTPEVRELPGEQLKALIGEYEELSRVPGVLGGQQLQLPGSATTVAFDTEEDLGGFFLLEADNLDEATAVAARVPAARMGGAVEVRPIVERWPRDRTGLPPPL